MYSTTSQTARPCSRTCALELRRAPAEVVASRHGDEHGRDPHEVGGYEATYRVKSEIVVSAGGLSSRRRMWRTSQPTRRPKAISPPAVTRNSPPV